MTLRVGVFAADDAGLESLARALVGHDAEIVARSKLDDDQAAVTQQLKTWIADAAIDVVVGALSARSRAALRPLITKRLLGFSEMQDVDGGRCATTVVVLVPPGRDPANDAVANVFPKIEHELTGKPAAGAAAPPVARIPSIPARPSGPPGAAAATRPPPVPPRIPPRPATTTTTTAGATVPKLPSAAPPAAPTLSVPTPPVATPPAATPAPARSRTPAAGVPIQNKTIALGDADMLGGARPKTIALDDANVLGELSNLDKPSLPAAQSSSAARPSSAAPSPSATPLASAVAAAVAANARPPSGGPPRPPPAGRTPASGVPVASSAAAAADSAVVAADARVHTPSSGVPIPTPSSGVPILGAPSPASASVRTPSSAVRAALSSGGPVAPPSSDASVAPLSSGVPVPVGASPGSAPVPTSVAAPGSGSNKSGPPRPPPQSRAPSSVAPITDASSAAAHAPGMIALSALVAADEASTDESAPSASAAAASAGGTTNAVSAAPPAIPARPAGSAPNPVVPLPSAPLSAGATAPTAHAPSSGAPTPDFEAPVEARRVPRSRAATEHVRGGRNARWIALAALVLVGGGAAAFALRGKASTTPSEKRVETAVAHEATPVAEIDAAVAQAADDIEMEPDEVGAAAKQPARPSRASRPSGDRTLEATSPSRDGESGAADTTSADTTKAAEPAKSGDRVNAGDTAKPAPVGTIAADGCDKVSCVVDNFERPCCAPFKPRRADEAPYQLDKPMIAAGIGKAKAAVIRCGEQHSTITGLVKVAVTVAPDGHVDTASVSESPDAALGDCVLAAVRKAAFAATEIGGTFTYPFKF